MATTTTKRRIYGANDLMAELIEEAGGLLKWHWVRIVSGPNAPDYLKGARGKLVRIDDVWADGLEIMLAVETSSGKGWHINIKDIEENGNQ